MKHRIPFPLIHSILGFIISCNSTPKELNFPQDIFTAEYVLKTEECPNLAVPNVRTLLKVLLLDFGLFSRGTSVGDSLLSFFKQHNRQRYSEESPPGAMVGHC